MNELSWVLLWGLVTSALALWRCFLPLLSFSSGFRSDKPMPARQIPAARMTDVSWQLKYLFKMFTVCWYKDPRGHISDSRPFSFWRHHPESPQQLMNVKGHAKQHHRLQQSCSSQLSFTGTLLCGFSVLFIRKYPVTHVFPWCLVTYIHIRAVHCYVVSQPGWLLSRWTVYTEWSSLTLKMARTLE